MSFDVRFSHTGEPFFIPMDSGSVEHIGQAKSKFAKALIAMEAVRKDAKNPAFKSKYASLGSVLDAVGAALDPQGLALTSTEVGFGTCVKVGFVITDAETGASFVAGYSSGYKPEKAGAQGTGSAETYAIRRGIMAVFGIATEDDDGAAASYGVSANVAPGNPMPPRAPGPMVRPPGAR